MIGFELNPLFGNVRITLRGESYNLASPFPTIGNIVFFSVDNKISPYESWNGKYYQGKNPPIFKHTLSFRKDGLTE